MNTFVVHLRQRILGFARPRAPEPLPARIDRRRVYVLPTRFGAFVGALLATMLLGALNYNNNPALLLGFLLAAAVHNSFIRAHLNLSGLTLDAISAESVPAGTPMSVQCLFSGDDRRARPHLQLRLAGATTHFSLAAGEHCTTTITWTPPKRGWQVLPRLCVQTRYPLGLAIAWCYFRPQTALLVYPRPEVRPPPLPVGEGESQAHGRRGHGEELHHLREYRQGDPPREVAWKASARAGQLLVREHEQPLARTVRLHWQATAGLAYEDRIARLAAWVELACRQQRRWSLHLPDAQLGPDQGAAHRHACLRLLAEMPHA